MMFMKFRKVIPFLYSYLIFFITVLGVIALTPISGAVTIDSLPYVINSSGYYELATDFNDFDPSASGVGYAIMINGSDVILDGNYRTLDGVDGTESGIYIENVSSTLSNITVRNLNLTDWGFGIYSKANEGEFLNNSFTSGNYGIYFMSSSNITITNNTFNSNSEVSIYLTSSNDNVICDNNISGIYGGIFLEISCYNNSITDNVVEVASFGYGYYLFHSNNNTLADNTAAVGPSGNSFYVSSSDNNTLTNNTASSGSFGLYLMSSSHNVFTNGSVTSAEYGIWVSSSTYNTVFNNIISLNDYGVGIDVSSAFNTITGNTIQSSSSYGIYFYDSDNNNIYNNLFNNTANFYFYSEKNTWNTTKTSGVNILGGNYLGGNAWYNPSGTGFSQTCNDTNSDGICDETYTLDVNNIDYLPITQQQISSIIDVSISGQIDFGNLDPDSSGNIPTSGGWPFNVTLNSTTNVAWNLSVKADDFTGPGVSTIDVSNLKFGNTSANVQYSMSTSYQGPSIFSNWRNQPAPTEDTILPVYFTLNVPEGQEGGEYYTLVYVNITSV